MAQRMLHFAIASELKKVVKINNVDELILGSLIPDFHLGETERNKTHYAEIKGDKKTINFTKFFNNNKQNIINNDLYLGYYIHLITDIFYRKYIYENEYIKSQKASLTKEEFKKNMYSDYKVLNYIIKEKYNLSYIHFKITDIPKELKGSNIDNLNNEMKNDFSMISSDSINYLNLSLLDGFMKQIIEILVNEINSIRNFNISTLCSNEFYY